MKSCYGSLGDMSGMTNLLNSKKTIGIKNEAFNKDKKDDAETRSLRTSKGLATNESNMALSTKNDQITISGYRLEREYLFLFNK